MKPINIFDYEALARERLQPAIWDYYQGGSDDEVTLRESRAVFERIRLRPRVLVDVSVIDMQTTILGVAAPMPVMVAPTAAHMLAHPEGECATARGAGQAGAFMIASTSATCTPEQIASEASGPLWFQLYTYRDLNVSAALVRRAEAAGYRAIVLTVDTPRLGSRERDLRNQFLIGKQVTMVNLPAVKEVALSSAARHTVDTWETVDWLRSVTSLPIVLKGILTAEDALLAAERGI
ncbi:MAG: alpha-hydroxy-acid oxidizing protein, partial [Ktedonobacteraceae bacterium]|nr:alpha-hydroxy-acid oxidizing protein [Ktedonobacteraceae bacterium]